MILNSDGDGRVYGPLNTLMEPSKFSDDVDFRQIPELLYNEYCEPTPYQQDTLAEDHLVWSALEYAQEYALAISAADFPQTTATRDWAAPAPHELDDADLSWHNSEAHAFFYDVAGRGLAHEPFGCWTPLRDVSFDSFRRLGFAIWSVERMEGYGFLVNFPRPDDDDPVAEENGRDPATPDSLLNAWRSVLGEDELAELETSNLERVRALPWQCRRPDGRVSLCAIAHPCACLRVLEGDANLEQDTVDDSSPVPMPDGSGETMSKGDFVRMQVLVRYCGNSRPSRENLAIIVSHPVS